MYTLGFFDGTILTGSSFELAVFGNYDENKYSGKILIIIFPRTHHALVSEVNPIIMYYFAENYLIFKFN